MYKQTLLLLIFIDVSVQNCMEIAEKDNEDYSNYLYEVMYESLKNVRSLIVLVDECKADGDLATSLTQLIQKPVYNFGYNLENGNEFYNNLELINDEENKIYLIFVENSAGIEQTFLFIQTLSFWKTRDKLFFILEDETTSALPKNTFRMFKQSFVLNVVVALRFRKIFTYNYFSDIDFIPVTPKTLFQKTNDNFFGHPLRISMFYDEVAAIKESGKYKGRDGWMARTLAKKLNATPVFREPRDGGNYGSITPTGLTGVFADVVYNFTDMALNSRFMDSHFKKYTEFTYPHDRDDLGCLVPVIRGSFGPKFAASFHKNLWILIFLTNLIFALIFFFDKNFNLLYLIAAFYQQPIPIFLFKSGKFLIFLYIIYSFYIISCFNSRLISVLTVPKDPEQIETLQDLENSNLEIYTVRKFKDLIIENGGNLVLPKMKIVDKEELTRILTLYEDSAMLTKNSIIEQAVLDRRNYKNGKAVKRMMSVSPLPTMVCYLLKYGSPLKEEFDRFLRKIEESGIQKHWKEHMLLQLFIKENQFYHIDYRKFKEISMKSLEQFFCFYVFGCCLGIIVFVLEIWKKKILFWFVIE